MNGINMNIALGKLLKTITLKESLFSLVIFIPSIEGGGVEKNLYYIANFLSKKKINVYILTAYSDFKKKFNNSIKFISLNKYEKKKK